MKRTLVELLHIGGGIAAAAVIASLSVWAVPGATRTIWWVACLAMLVIVFMGLRPLREARAQDRAAARAEAGAPDNG